MSIIKSNYERIIARCPRGHINVYSRVSDLHSAEPIDGRNVSCDHCKITYWIHGDTINPAYQMLLMDCHDLGAEKRYMYCILNICQAYEMFFSLYFRSRLYHGFANEGMPHRLEMLNELLADLHELLSDFTFGSLRCNFIRISISNPRPKTLDEAKAIVRQIDRNDRDASKLDLNACQDAKLKDKLAVIQASGIHRLRNDVVHQSGYRPTLEQVNAALDEASDVLFVMPGMLGVWDDDLHVYMSGLA